VDLPGPKENRTKINWRRRWGEIERRAPRQVRMSPGSHVGPKKLRYPMVVYDGVADLADVLLEARAVVRRAGLTMAMPARDIRITPTRKSERNGVRRDEPGSRDGAMRK